MCCTTTGSQSMPPFLLLRVLLAAALLTASVASAQDARGVRPFAGQGEDPLSPELRKQVQALKGALWDQRMARQFGMGVEMPASEVEGRVKRTIEWAEALTAADLEPVFAFEARAAAARKAASGQGDADLALRFIEDVGFELQLTEENKPSAFGSLTAIADEARFVFRVGERGLPAGRQIAVAAPGIKVQGSVADAEGHVSLRVGGKQVAALVDPELPHWLPADQSVVWELTEAAAPDTEIEVQLAVPPAFAADVAVLAVLEDRGPLMRVPRAAPEVR